MISPTAKFFGLTGEIFGGTVVAGTVVTGVVVTGIVAGFFARSSACFSALMIFITFAFESSSFKLLNL